MGDDEVAFGDEAPSVEEDVDVEGPGSFADLEAPVSAKLGLDRVDGRKKLAGRELRLSRDGGVHEVGLVSVIAGAGAPE